jgi:hypothetical protein
MLWWRLQMRNGVFLSETEHHLVRPVVDPQNLRARITLHALFAESLVVTDSQILNNPVLRLILTGDGGGAWLGGMADLIRSGGLIVARRDTADSFRQIRDEHNARKVENVPEEGYAEWLDELTEGHVLPYPAVSVSQRFKERLISELAKLIVEPNDRYKRTLGTAIEWIHTQDPLYYNSIRKWAARRPTPDEATRIALETVERTASWAFKMALPAELDTAVAWGAVRTPAAVSLMGDDVEGGRLLLPGYFLNPDVLARLPIALVNEATELPSRQIAVAQIARAYGGESVDLELLEESVREFVRKLQKAAVAEFHGRSEDALAAVQEKQLNARFHISPGTVIGGGVGLVIGLIGGNPDLPGTFLNLLMGVGFDSLQDKQSRLLRDRAENAEEYSRILEEVPESERLLRIVSSVNSPD